MQLGFSRNIFSEICNMTGIPKFLDTPLIKTTNIFPKALISVIIFFLQNSITVLLFRILNKIFSHLY